MDHSDNVSRQIDQTIDQLKMRIEFENYFSDEAFRRTGVKKSKAAGKKARSESVSKKELIAPLYEKVMHCQACPLHKTRKNVVFGDGSLDAKLVFVGEAPGRDEDIQGKPFVGLAGGLLTKIINAMQMSRSEVFITNVLRCRPPGNRNPLPEEVVCCKPYLIRLLDIIRPRMICTLGKFAAHALLDVTSPISSLRGQFYEFQGIKLMPTYHPAYLLRNPEDKRLVWDDMKKMMKALKQDEA